MYVLFIVDALERIRIEDSLRNAGNDVELACPLQPKTLNVTRLNVHDSKYHVNMSIKNYGYHIRKEDTSSQPCRNLQNRSC